MDGYGISSQARRRTQRQISSNTASSLKLPSLPRFHPANFPSQHSGGANTPATNPNSPQPPLSPLSQQKQYSEAQKQLYYYQRELLNAGSRKSTTIKPVSPRLVPLGSPGPVTPLELESGGYISSGSGSACVNEATQGELIEKLIREEAKRRGETSSPSFTR